MRLPDEMRRLADQLREAHESRREAHTARMDVVAGLRTEATQVLEKQHTAHEEMAEALRRQLDEATATRRAAEEHRRTVTGSMLSEIEGEMAGAHGVWAEFGGLMRQARFGGSGLPSAAGPMPTQPMPRKKGRASHRRASQ